MNAKIKGSLCGIISAITYGLNPLGGLKLYSTGLNVDSVMFYRYGLATLLLAGIMFLQKTSFKVSRRELLVCGFLGVIFAFASITFFTSFYYMDAGMSCTLLFVYPVMVAVIMAIFFKERITVITTFSILMALTGIGLLYHGGDGVALSTLGVVLVMVSALAYAIYIVVVNKSGVSLPPVTLTFYVMVFGVLTIALHSLTSEANRLLPLTTLEQWLWVAMLAIVPTVISLITMVVAIKYIGSTPTSIMGALEPVTAVMIGVMVFNESFTLRIALSMLLILVAVSLIIIEKPLTRRLLSGRRLLSKSTG